MAVGYILLLPGRDTGWKMRGTRRGRNAARVEVRAKKMTMSNHLKEAAEAPATKRAMRVQLSLPQDLGRGPRITSVSWDPAGSVSLKQWIVHGHRLGTIGRGVTWWIGDWLQFGNAQFGERYVRASRITGYDVQTLMNLVYVASRFEPPRRREELSWSHHAELAALDVDEQEHWLSRAQAERFSVRDLRAELRRVQRASRAREPGAAPIDAGGAPPAAAPADADDAVVCPKCGHELATASATGAARDRPVRLAQVAR